jgi:hypothetical protein
VSAPTIPAGQGTAPPLPGTGSGRAFDRWLRVGALGAAVAGGLHVAAAVDHLEAGDLAVAFFLATALAQLGLASWLLLMSATGLRPDLRLLGGLALVGTVALLGLYVVAHTTGLLDAFAVHDGAGHGGAHGSSGHDPGIDPVTGVDYSEGIADRPGGPVAMAGDAVAASHAPGLLGSATVGAELLLITALTALQPAAWRQRTVNALATVGALAWVLWFTGVLA